MFLVPEKTKNLRPVIELKLLTIFLVSKRFKMETAQRIRSLDQGMWVLSIDLKDAYFHIPIHSSSQEISKNLHGRKSLPVQGSSIQNFISPMALHQGTCIKKVGSHSQEKMYSHSSISRQLFEETVVQGEQILPSEWSPPIHCSENSEDLGLSSDKPICHQKEEETAHVCLSSPRWQSMGRRYVNSFDSSSSVFVSSDLHHDQRARKDSSGKLPSNSSSMSNPILTLSSAGNGSRHFP